MSLAHAIFVQAKNPRRGRFEAMLPWQPRRTTPGNNDLVFCEAKRKHMLVLNGQKYMIRYMIKINIIYKL